jgi:hypothetical protein
MYLRMAHHRILGRVHLGQFTLYDILKACYDFISLTVLFTKKLWTTSGLFCL